MSGAHGPITPEEAAYFTGISVNRRDLAKAEEILKYVLALRMHGEDPDHGAIPYTWEKVDRDVEAFLRRNGSEVSCGTQHPSSLVHKDVYDGLQRSYERGRLVQKDLRNKLDAANALLATYGWERFGTHAGDDPSPENVEFSDAKDEAGLPLWERVITDAEG